MTAIPIRISGPSLDAAFKKLGSRGGRAVTAALNRTIAGVNTVAVRTISADLGATQKFIRPALKIKRASESNPVAQEIATGKRILLLAFAARQTLKGITYNVHRSRRDLIPSAFIRITKKRVRMVLKRLGKEAYPLRFPAGPSIPLVFSHKKVLTAIKDRIDEQLPKELKQAFKFFGT